MNNGFLQRWTDRAERFALGLRSRIYPLDVLIRAAQQFTRDAGMTYAAAMSYYVLFSLFPMMIFMVVVFGIVVRDPAMQEQVVDAVIDVVPEGFEVRSTIQNVIADVSAASSPIIAAASLAVTAWTASNMFGALRRALNLAFETPQARNFLVGRLMDMLNLPIIMLLALLSVGTFTVVRVVEAFYREYLPGGQTATAAWNVVYFVLPYLISFLFFVMVYRVIPNHRLPMRFVVIGAAIAAIGFEAAKGAFGLYVANFGNYQEVYGALGGVVAFLFFVFIVANIVIFAAEITAEVAKDFEAPSHEVLQHGRREQRNAAADAATPSE
jgi:membrane protein